MNAYTCVFYAQRPTSVGIQIQYTSGHLIARDMQDARKWAKVKLFEVFPSEKGYEYQDTVVNPIDSSETLIYPETGQSYRILAVLLPESTEMEGRSITWISSKTSA